MSLCLKQEKKILIQWENKIIFSDPIGRHFSLFWV